MRTDIFGLAVRQHDLFGAPQESFDAQMTAEEIRAELRDAVDLLCRSEVLPWSTKLALRADTMFPEMAGRLPAAEAEELVAAYTAEMHRLRSKAA